MFARSFLTLNKNIFSAHNISTQNVVNKTEKFVNSDLYYKMSVGVFTVLANCTYAVMRAKDRHEKGADEWVRFFSFIWGLPFSVFTYACVTEGSNVAFGLHLGFLDCKNKQDDKLLEAVRGCVTIRSVDEYDKLQKAELDEVLKKTESSTY